MGNEVILKLSDVRLKYGPIEAIKGVTMEIREGEICAILGANGAGKSTIIKAVGGLIKPTAGDITFYGQSTRKLTSNKIANLGIVTSPEGRLIMGDLTVEENLMVGSYALKGRVSNIKAEIVKNLKDVYSYFPILNERKKQLASTLSGGEQQMLAIGRALMGSPKILLLDEPSLGLAPLIIKDIFEIITAIAKNGTTVLIVEQNALQTLKIADYTYLLELGKIKVEGLPSDILQNNELISAYLGG